MPPQPMDMPTNADTTSQQAPPSSGAAVMKHKGDGLAGYRPTFERSFAHPRYWATWALLGVQGVCLFLPRRLSLAIGAALGGLFFRINAKRRRIARINLELCFPQLAEEERERLLRAHFRVAGQTTIDLGIIWWGSTRRLERLVHLSGIETLTRLSAEGKSAVVLTAHFLGTDLGGIYASRFVPSATMIKEIRNPVVNWFVCRGRSRFGTRLILRRHGLRPLLGAMRHGHHCYYLPDEDFGPQHSVFVPLFGLPAATLPTLSRLARVSGAVVVPCFTRLDPESGRYHIQIGPAETDFPRDDAIAGAKRMNELIEAAIRAAPEQYMWTFRWFRTRPDGAPSPYA